MPIVIDRWLARARGARWTNVTVVFLRLAIGFAFLPAAMKKLWGEPFTDAHRHGRFHDFLHAFYATGWFYGFVGALQLAAAVLLLTQRFATVGAAVALPIVTAIGAFCWSTAVYPTAVVVTLMGLGTVGLLVWDLDKWRGVFAADTRGHQLRIAPIAAPIDLRLWSWCGVAIVGCYVVTTVARGGVYRPRGVELAEPGFWVTPGVLVLALVTLIIDQRRVGRAAQQSSPA